jgi:hypothetical protein
MNRYSEQSIEREKEREKKKKQKQKKIVSRAMRSTTKFATKFARCIFCISPEPDLKWAQDPKKIYLTIGMKCNSAENHPVLTEDMISFSCKDKAGKERYVSILACQKN